MIMHRMKTNSPVPFFPVLRIVSGDPIAVAGMGAGEQNRDACDCNNDKENCNDPDCRIHAEYPARSLFLGRLDVGKDCSAGCDECGDNTNDCHNNT